MRNGTAISEYTQPYVEAGLVIVAPVKQVTPSAWTFLKPFTLEMWCVTGALFILVGVVVWILEHRINEEFRGSPRRQVVTIFWYISVSTLRKCFIIVYHTWLESKFRQNTIVGSKCF